MTLENAQQINDLAHMIATNNDEVRHIENGGEIGELPPCSGFFDVRESDPPAEIIRLLKLNQKYFEIAIRCACAEMIEI